MDLNQRSRLIILKKCFNNVTTEPWVFGGPVPSAAYTRRVAHAPGNLYYYTSQTNEEIDFF